MRKAGKILSVLLLNSVLILGACSQKTCPGVDSANRGKPSGGSEKANQQLFDKDKR